MTKRVILKLDGDFEQQGFRVTLEIIPERPSLSDDLPYFYTTEVSGMLPPAPDLIAHLNQWQQTYRKLITSTRAIKPHRVTYGGSINPIDACRKSARDLEKQLQTWLKAEPFQEVNLRLREVLSQQDTIQVLIRSPHPQLSYLPWHKWDFIERYPHAEITFSPPEFELISATPATPTPNVRILAILGNSTNINVTADRQLLESLPNADVTFLVEPQRQQINDRLWEQSWDILFFAGHSDSDQGAGRIYINPHDSLTIEELHYGLKRAIAQGLQLAIFNSCDGLGLARSLADLHIPHLIVMREPVPDQVAQQFLLYFLSAFAGGQLFHLAVRTARERLQGIEDRFPCASWLPVVYQNPAARSPTWESLYRKTKPRSTPVHLSNFYAPWMMSGLIALAVILSRSTGILQPLELKAYDAWMQLRPNQEQDNRLLLVTITEADVAAQSSNDRRGASLTDADLQQLLQRLQTARVIGLDVYRDFATGANYPELKQFLRQDDRLITTCSFGQQGMGIAPPPEIPASQIRTRVGFSSTVIDLDDRIRRHLLMQTASDSVCTSDISLGLLTALRYLKDEGIYLEWTTEETPQIKIGNVIFHPLDRNAGGYQSIDDRGHQILLNYRNSKTGVAPKVTLTQVLKGEVDPDLIRDRIVLVGNTDPSFRDFHLTPYSQTNLDKIPGVEIQAHMVSQILSSVLDGQPLIRSASTWMETFWIISWAIVGGGIVWRVQSLRTLAFMSSGAIVLLTGCCYVLFLGGYWLPLIPAGFALGGTIMMSIVFKRIKPTLLIAANSPL